MQIQNWQPSNKVFSKMKNVRVCFTFCLLWLVGNPEKNFQIGGSICDEWNQGVYLRFLICQN